MDLNIRDFRVRESVLSRLLKIIKPFSIHFWIATYLITLFILINKYVISNFALNIVYILISLVILFY